MGEEVWPLIGKDKGRNEREDGEVWEGGGKDKAPCAMSSKGLWSNR